ncbi:MAG: tyrosine-type recombinase/integrase [Chitinophagaceae bacterium]|jgi:integrase/recombinase XerC
MSDIRHPFIEDFINHLKFEKRYSTHTLRAYTDDLAVFFQFLTAQFEVVNPQEVMPAMVRSWLASLSLQKIQPRSINRKISSLKSFYRYCLLKGYVASSPLSAIKVLKTRKRLPNYIEETQMQQLLEQIDFTDDYTGRLHYLIITLLYHTGMRVSELVSLKDRQVDTKRLQVKVLGKGNKERIIPLHHDIVGEVDEYRKLRSGLAAGEDRVELLLNEKGKPLSPRHVYDIVKRRLSLVTTAEKKSPHILRHSFATHLTGNGAELNAVKELLGHSSLAATQVYTHTSIDRLRDIHRKSHPKG